MTLPGAGEGRGCRSKRSGPDQENEWSKIIVPLMNDKTKIRNVKIPRVFGILLIVNILVLSGYAQPKTFSNPLLPSGADPWCIYKNGYYYYTNTTGNNITLWKTKNIALLKTAEKKVVFTPPASVPYSKELWAPEIHYLQGKWYIYFAADSGKNRSHRLWVLETLLPIRLKEAGP